MGGETFASALQNLIDKYTLTATKLIKVGEIDLAIFYKNCAWCYSERLRKMTIEECMTAFEGEGKK